MPKRVAYFRDDTKTVQLWTTPNQFSVRNCETFEQACRMTAQTRVPQSLERADTPTGEINRLWIDRSFAKYDQGA